MIFYLSWVVLHFITIGLIGVSVCVSFIIFGTRESLLDNSCLSSVEGNLFLYFVGNVLSLPFSLFSPGTWQIILEFLDQSFILFHNFILLIL